MPEIKSVCVYCGSSARVDQKYKDAAIELGKLIAAQGWNVVYGGGRVGLMGLVADSALSSGARVVGRALVRKVRLVDTETLPARSRAVTRTV